MEKIERILGGERDDGGYVYSPMRRRVKISRIYKVSFLGREVDVGITLSQRVWEELRVLLR